MQRLILVKHSAPAIDPTRPAASWHLSPEGRARSTALAALLAPYQPDCILSSHEPKAMETAGCISEVLGVQAAVYPGLHEHERTGVPLFADPHDFERAVLACLSRPGERVFGTETADEAHARFAAAVQSAAAAHAAASTLVIVAHGTVISLLVGRRNERDPLGETIRLWRCLGLPSFVVLDPSGQLVDVVETIVANPGASPGT